MTLPGFQARLSAVGHWLRGHDVHWRMNADEHCPGDITCETCQLVIWCRGMETER